jgi:putative spermidine/putrescine transport system substrate-binding protein
MRTNILRRRSILLIAAAVVAGGTATAVLAANSLTFVAWGGTTEERQVAAWGPEFTKQTGYAVQPDSPTDYGKLKAMVDAGQVVWDVVDVEADFARRAAKEGLLEKIDYSVVNKDGLDPQWSSDYGVGSFYYAFVLAYNKKVLGDKEPQNWQDFFDLQKFPQKRSIIGWPTTGVVEMALLADGVKPENLYPLDLDRAFKKLATLKGHLVFWNSGAESQQLLASGEAPICFCWDTRVSVMMADPSSPPLGISWYQNIGTGDVLVIPRGSKNKDAAMKFLAVASSPEGQARLDEAALLSPINSKAMALIKPETMPKLAAGHQDSQIQVNLDYWVEHGPEVTDAWNKWKLQ